MPHRLALVPTPNSSPSPAYPPTSSPYGGWRGRPGLRVAVVDDCAVVRDGLPLLMPKVAFAGSFVDSESLLAAAPDVDVVILEVCLQASGRLDIRDGVDAVRELVRAGHRVCLYSNERRRMLLTRCLMAGATGIVHKTEPTAALQEAIGLVAAGQVVITEALVGLADLFERGHRLPTLTPRQREVLGGRARGESFRSIARRLNVSEKTAQEHMTIVAGKFAGYLRHHSPADLERELGLDSGDRWDATAGGF